MILNSADNNLSGKIPLDLQVLPDLSRLTLSFNKLQSSIPTSFYVVTSLEWLELDHNQFTGILDESTLPILTGLRTLDLSSNFFEGSLPTNFGDLRTLQILCLDNNNLSGWIEPLANLSNLNMLTLSNNLFNDRISNNFHNLRRLQDLDLSGNNIGGSIIPDLFDLPNIRTIDLSDNLLSSTLPGVEIPSSLTTFLAYENRLEGKIPSSFGQATSLKRLDLSSNTLTGSIPEAMWVASNLESLFLGANFYEGWSMPENITLPNLVELSLRNSSLFGTLPRSIGTMGWRNLQFLDLGENNLVGDIPDGSLANLIQLRFLLLNRNFLTGTVGGSLVRLDNLGACGVGLFIF